MGNCSSSKSVESAIYPEKLVKRVGVIPIMTEEKFPENKYTEKNEVRSKPTRYKRPLIL
jgi:hypothetical protein